MRMGWGRCRRVYEIYEISGYRSSITKSIETPPNRILKMTPYSHAFPSRTQSTISLPALPSLPSHPVPPPHLEME